MSNTNQGAARAGPSSRRRRPAVLIALAVLGAGGVAAATDGEKYPAANAPEIASAIDAWKKRIEEPKVEMCTGAVLFTRTEEERAPVGSLPGQGPWQSFSSHAGGFRHAAGGGAREASFREASFGETIGDDTDETGSDSYLVYRVAAIGASVFARVILEAEDDADVRWQVRVRGQEEVAIANDPTRRAEKLEIENTYDVQWDRRVVDFDALGGERGERKSVRQDFTATLTLIDGTKVTTGGKFEHDVPMSEAETTSVGFGVKGTLGDKSAVEAGLQIGWSASETYSAFRELSASQRGHRESGSVLVKDDLTCPDSKRLRCESTFDGDFVIEDGTSINGDRGSRQELALAIVSYVSSVKATECHDCDVWERREPPPTTPPPTRKPDPATTPGDGPLPPPSGGGTAGPTTTPPDAPIGDDGPVPPTCGSPSSPSQPGPDPSDGGCRLPSPLPDDWDGTDESWFSQGGR